VIERTNNPCEDRGLRARPILICIDQYWSTARWFLWRRWCPSFGSRARYLRLIPAR